LLIAYAVLDRDRVGDTARSRSFVYGGTSTLLVALATVAVVSGYALAKRHDRTWDLTREQRFTLSDHSQGVLQALGEDIEVLAFFRSGSVEARDFRRLMERVAEQTERIEVTWVDPLRQPRLAEEHDITSDFGTVILRSADARTQRMDADLSEELLVRKLVLLLSREEHQICWSLGHGEPDPDDEFGERGLGAVVIELEQLNYQVLRQTLPTSGIARTCDALVIARPEIEWMPWEREALAAYLGEGGRVLLLLEPLTMPDFAGELERYGLRLRDDVVLDVNPQNQMMGVDDPSFVVLHGRNLLSHPITSSLAAAVVLPISRSVEPIRDTPGVVAQAVLETSSEAWGEIGVELDTIPQPDADELVGEVPVMAVTVIEEPAVLEVLAHDEDAGRAVPQDYAPQAGGRLVVIGDADFASNGYLMLGNNRDLFLNTIAWLVDEEAQIGERPDEGELLELTDIDAGILCLLSVLFVPGGAAVLALITILRRRRL